LDDLIQARASGHNQTTINELRDLILAGSRLTYRRMGEKEILSDFALLREMQRRHPETMERLPAMARRERDDWERKRSDTRRDPSTYREIEENRKEALEELAFVENAIRDRKVGDDLEQHVRTIEDVLASSWTRLKQTMAAHGLSIESARVNGSTKPLFEAIEDLRHIRDLLYYRRVHPDWAKIAIHGEKATSRP
jgi:hypothetical protein